jgi:hypothetical protein
MNKYWIAFNVRHTGRYGNYSVNGSLNGFFQDRLLSGERVLVRYLGTGATGVGTIYAVGPERDTPASLEWELADQTLLIRPYEEPILDIDLDK